MNAQSQLLKTVSIQDGYFTAKQAESAGFIRSNHSYHVNNGAWVREGRGLYRLNGFVQSQHSEYWRLLLLFRNHEDQPLGHFCRETVLTMHDLSDVNPGKIQMCMPKNFKTNLEIPKVLEIFKEDLMTNDITTFQGLPVTTMEKTLLDISSDGRLEEDSIELAAKEALKKGLISKKFFKDHPSLARFAI